VAFKLREPLVPERSQESGISVAFHLWARLGAELRTLAVERWRHRGGDMEFGQRASVGFAEAST
jgi:hypothetical protein